MEILLRNIPSNGSSCVLYDCKDCGLSGAPDCQDMADFLGKKKRETFEEQENTRELEALERLEKRIEELERIHCAPPPSPLIAQPYQQIPEDPHFPITCSGESVSDVEIFLSETRDD